MTDPAHRFTRPARVPLFHDLKGIGSSSSDLLMMGLNGKSTFT
ncbi:hypothetical protein ABT030_48740 [Streptomyces mirabilis]